jgi:hypothetical protein
MYMYIRNVATSLAFFSLTLASQNYFSKKAKLETDRILEILKIQND